MKKFIFTLMFLPLIAIASQSFYKADINSKTAFKKQQNGVTLIDVRTKKEYEYLHPKGALNIPVFFEKYGKRVFNETFVQRVEQTLGDTDAPVILICRSGSRTKYAANLLAKQGFSEVYNIENGFAYDWTKANLPVEK